jgi:hypothetical protein
VKTARERAIEIAMAMSGWTLGRALYMRILESPEAPPDMPKLIAAIEAGIERDRLEVLGAHVARLCLEKGPVT